MFDGTEYECEVKHYDESEYSWYLGNLRIMSDTYEDTGEPFCIIWGEVANLVCVPGKYLGHGFYEYYVSELKVYIPTETVSPMAKEFLPTEEWTFTLKDGSTVTKKVAVSK